MKPAIDIANSFLHPDIIVWPRDGDRLVHGHVLPTYKQEVRIGAGAYTAQVLAAQDVPIRLYDRIGNDVYGELTMAGLSAFDTSAITRYDGEHMFCLSIVDETGEGGTMVINYPASWRRDLASFRAEIDATSAPILYLYSWFWTFAHTELAGAATGSLVEAAASRGARILLDVNYKPAHPPPENDMSELRRVIPLLDVLMPNARDASLLVGNGLARAETVRALQQLGARRLVLKCGSEGAYVADGAGPITHVKAPSVHVIETTGAGDTFGGAFAAAWHRGRDLVDAAAEGAAAAALAISSPPAERYRSAASVAEFAATLERRVLPE